MSTDQSELADRQFRYFSERDHKQVPVVVGPRAAEVDEGMAPLVEACWKNGIDTILSCEDAVDDLAWVSFPTWYHLRWFLQDACDGRVPSNWRLDLGFAGGFYMPKAELPQLVEKLRQADPSQHLRDGATEEQVIAAVLEAVVDISIGGHDLDDATAARLFDGKVSAVTLGDHKKDVVISYLHPGTVDGHFCASLTELMMWDTRNDGRVLAVNGMGYGPDLSVGRNLLVMGFLENYPDAEWLWFVDADETFAPDTLDALLRVAEPTERPVVSALIFSGRPDSHIFPESCMLDESATERSYTGEKYMPIAGWEPGALLDVDAVGAGGLVVHRSVLDQMLERWGWPEPWFPVVGGDYGFCERVKELGFPVVVDTGVEMGHVKRAIIDGTSYRRYQERLKSDSYPDILAEDYIRTRWGVVHRPGLVLGQR